MKIIFFVALIHISFGKDDFLSKKKHNLSKTIKKEAVTKNQSKILADRMQSEIDVLAKEK